MKRMKAILMSILIALVLILIALLSGVINVNYNNPVDNGGGSTGIFQISAFGPGDSNADSSFSDFGGGSGLSEGDGSNAAYGGRGAFLSDSQTGSRTYCSVIRASGDCVSQYTSVCGWLDSGQIKCTDGPCVRRYAGECEACVDNEVLYWTEGECPYH